MNKYETKFNNTAKKMYQALFKLLEIKNFSDITISEICKCANVNRTTFYSHFDNTYDLLQEAGDNFSKEFLVDFSKNINEISPTDIKMETFVNEKYIVPFLNFVKSNKSFFKIYLNNYSSFNVNKEYSFLMDKIGKPALKSKNITDESTINYISKFYFNGVISIIGEWINNNCNDDVMFICKLIILCIVSE